LSYCKNCGKKLSKKIYNLCKSCNLKLNPYWKGKKHSEETKQKMSISRKGKLSTTLGKTWKVQDTSNYIKKGDNNSRWKGDNVSYKGLHKWIRENKLKSDFCEECRIKTDKLEVANLSGEYLRDVNDFRWLCRKCNQNDGIKMLEKHKIEVFG